MSKGSVAARIRSYCILMRLNRPIGILLLLWPTLWALWIAGDGHPDAWIFTVFVLGVLIMRSAGCAINDFADRGYDPHVRRTRDRPLAAGQVSPREALVLFGILCATAFGLVMTMNRLTILLSFVALFLAATYPFIKRYSFLPQVYLGAAFGWAIPMVFAAQTAVVPNIAWLLFIATVLWATAYDTMYAMVDRADDLRIGVKSTAILFGLADRAMIALVQVLVLIVLSMIGNLTHMGRYYFSGLIIAAALACYQQYLIKDRDEESCFRAFLNNNWFGAVVFSGIALHYLAR